MSYLVLARKYRPRSFSEVAGQEVVTRTLAGAIAENRVGHAYLFAGPRGTGKTTSARLFAKALNCEAGPIAEPCGTCDRCLAADAGNEADTIEIDGASNTGVDNVRELREQAAYAPLRARFKIYIIDEVHMLSKPAFNALLKTLEEPPPHVKFLFATTEPHKVLDTILSRCQVLRLSPISEDTIRARLDEVFGLEGIEAEAGVTSELARRARGGMRDALSMADQLLAQAGSRPTMADVEGLASEGSSARIEALMQLVEAGDKAGLLGALPPSSGGEGELLSGILDHLRGCLLTALCGADAPMLSADESARRAMFERGRRLGPRRLERWLEEGLRVRERLRLLPSHARLALEVALLDMATPEARAPIPELIARLEGLERRLIEGGARSAPAAAPAAQPPISQPLDSGTLDSVPLDSVPLDSVPLDSVPLDSVPLDSGPPVSRLPVVQSPAADSRAEPPPPGGAPTPAPPSAGAPPPAGSMPPPSASASSAPSHASTPMGGEAPSRPASGQAPASARGQAPPSARGERAPMPSSRVASSHAAIEPAAPTASSTPSSSATGTAAPSPTSGPTPGSMSGAAPNARPSAMPTATPSATPVAPRGDAPSGPTSMERTPSPSSPPLPPRELRSPDEQARDGLEEAARQATAVATASAPSRSPGPTAPPSAAPARTAPRSAPPANGGAGVTRLRTNSRADAWAQLMTHLGERAGALAEVFGRRGRLLAIEGQRVIVQVAGLHDGDRAMLGDRRNRAIAEAILEEMFARPMELVLDDADLAKPGSTDRFTTEVAQRFEGRIED